MLTYIPSTARYILDIGCNTGGFGATLKATRQVEVWGVEPDASAAAQASKCLDKVVISPFDGEVTIPDRHFDVVVFNDVLEHMVDPWAALSLAGTKLREDGVVVASIPNLRHIDCVEHILIHGDFHYEGSGIRDRTHLRFFTKRSAQRLFEESGFEVIRIDGINASWWTPSIMRRLAFRLWSARLEDMKYQQFALVARPVNHRF